MNSFLALVLLLPLLAVASETGGYHTRRDQGNENDPCSVLYDEATVAAGKFNFNLFRPSFVENCFSSLVVDKEGMLHHLRSLNQIFAQSYCFYNIAKDPPASQPQAHQPELGYTIFQGDAEGQVDIDSEMSALIRGVEDNGATVATFWEVNSIFNRLRDGHVVLPNFNSNSLANKFNMFLIPDRCQDGKITARSDFVTGPDSELQLIISWKHEDGTSTESLVRSIGGMSVYSFFSNMANSPGPNLLYYQSEGSRLNALLSGFRAQDLVISKELNAIHQPFVLATPKAASRPSETYHDSIQVVYDDGKEETYHAALSIPTLSPLIDKKNTSKGMIIEVNRTRAKTVLDEPGDAYEIFQRAKGMPVGTSDSKRKLVQSRSQQEIANQTGDISGDGFFPPDQVAPGKEAALVAFKIEEQYAILKVQGFEIDSQDVINGWKALAAAAKQKGVKKLIVDISNNGGGWINSGVALAVLMYPTVDYKWFQKNFDIVINEPLRVYSDVIYPVLSQLAAIISALPDADYQTVIDALNEEQVETLILASEALIDLCESIICVDDEFKLPQDQCEHNCDHLEVLKKMLSNFVQYKSPPLLRELATELIIRQLVEYHPLRLEMAGVSDISEGYRTVNRGGVQTNLTNPFNLSPESLYYQAVATAFQSGHMFEEYIILSNGVAGSTSSIFESSVSQLWKNRDRSMVKSPLITCSYGGTTNPGGDLTTGGWPASNQDIHIENLLIAAGILYMMDVLIPTNTSIESSVFDAFQKYLDVVPEAPYYAKSLPSLPVMNYYSTFMGADALPLQYVKMPPDEHIPTYYIRTRIEDSGDLAGLYADASRYFSVIQGDFNEAFADETTSGGVSFHLPAYLALATLAMVSWLLIF